MNLPLLATTNRFAHTCLALSHSRGLIQKSVRNATYQYKQFHWSSSTNSTLIPRKTLINVSLNCLRCVYLINSTRFLSTKLYNNSSCNAKNKNQSSIRCKSNTAASPAFKTNSISKNHPVSSTLSVSDGKTIVDRYLYVKTLDGMYEDVPNGIVLDTAYGDSRPDTDFDQSSPVIVCLHDTPGTHRDVVPLMDVFAKIGCRAICPTFPGHGDTRGIMRNYDDTFSQATLERAAFVHDFLGNLDIKRVDVLIGVGAASYTAMALCSRLSDVYKSMALISPWPLTKSRYDIDSKTLAYIHEMWELVYFRPLVKILLKRFKVGNAVTVDDKIALWYLAKNVDYGEVDGLALTTSIQDIPRLVVHGSADDQVSEELYKEVLAKLDIPSDKIFTGQKNLLSKEKFGNATSVVFPDSGYDLLTEQRSALCASILRLIQHFHPHIKI